MLPNEKVVDVEELFDPSIAEPPKLKEGNDCPSVPLNSGELPNTGDVTAYGSGALPNTGDAKGDVKGDGDVPLPVTFEAPNVLEEDPNGEDVVLVVEVVEVVEDVEDGVEDGCPNEKPPEAMFIWTAIVAMLAFISSMSSFKAGFDHDPALLPLTLLPLVALVLLDEEEDDVKLKPTFDSPGFNFSI